METWVHWVLFNIPANVHQLEEALTTLPAGTPSGMANFKKLGYGGPCPPSSMHQYFFKLYALNAALSLGSGTSKTEIGDAMKKHILGQAQLIGLSQCIP